jgi:SAM-dependent methyltransferase
MEAGDLHHVASHVLIDSRPPGFAHERTRAVAADERALVGLAALVLDVGAVAAQQDLVRTVMRGGGRQAGEGYTPWALRMLMVAAAEPTGAVLDPCAGTGSLLIEAAEAAGRAGRPVTLTAADINPDAVAILQARLGGIPGSRVERGDVLGDDPFRNREFDRVLVDPPLGRRVSATGERLRASIRSSDDFAWLEYALDHLAPGGTGVVITTAAVLTRPGPDEQSRRALLRTGDVRAIVTLPGLAGATSVPIALWILRGLDRTNRDLPLVLVDATDLTSREWTENRDLHTGMVVKALQEAESGLATADGPIRAVAVDPYEARSRDANLNPAYWIVRSRRPDADKAEQALTAALAALTMAVGRVSSEFAIPLEVIRTVPPTFELLERLADDRRVIIHRGSRIENAAGVDGVVTPLHVLAGDLGPGVEGNGAPNTTPITRPGAVIFLPEGAETRAIVDDAGGHHLQAPLVAIEIDAEEEGLTSVIVASWLNSAETRSLATGSTLQRISLRHVTLPVFEPEVARLLTASILSVQREVDSAQGLLDAASALQSDVLQSLTAGVVAATITGERPDSK